MDFRVDINGLRAWAVALVMLYHFGVPGFAGGFVGVDVFFVISGYLMTAIILGRQTAGRFSVIDFYLARARRIVPALAVVCLSLLVFGWFWLGATDYTALGKHAGAAILFFSNQVFANEAGYFDSASHEKWLLHTWSLSVEWQFYLLYPLLLAGGVRFSRWPAQNLIGGALLVSLVYALWLSAREPGAGFYILAARAWELLAGGLVCLYAGEARRWPVAPAWLEGVGFMLIVLAGVRIDMNHWPGPLVIVPVLGAVLVLLANRQSSLLTAHPVVQALGRWSYSIYLWHWPLLVAALYLHLPRGLGLSLGLLAGSVALGALSYRFVEEPFRHTRFGRQMRWRSMGLLVLAVAVPVVLIIWSEGVPARLPAALAPIETQRLEREEAVMKSVTGESRCAWKTSSGTLPECRFGAATAPPSVAVWGDSHASKSIPAIHEAARRQGIGVYLYFRNGCRPLQGLVTEKRGAIKDCRAYNRAVFDRLAGNPAVDTVLLIASWPYDLGAGKMDEAAIRTYFGVAPLETVEARHREYTEHLLTDLCALKQFKKRVAITAPLPYFGVDVPRTMASRYLLDGVARAPSQTRREHAARNARLLGVLDEAQRRCGIEVLDPLPYFCDADTCRGARDGVPLYSDDNHLGRFGNTVIRPLFEDFFRAGLQSR
jgi:peptidoglycan/LPS O-acetylase OafA/YrhL